MSYFISSPDETSWDFDATWFSEQLRRWEGVEQKTPDAPSYLPNNALEWTVPMRFGTLFGALDHTEQVIHLDGFLGDCALFALWLRQIVPHDVELLFYDEDYSADVALMIFTAEADLIRAFGA